MPIKLETSSSEQLLAPGEMLAGNVFESVSQSFIDEAESSFASEDLLVNAQEGRTVTGPRPGFVETRFAEAERTIAPLAELPMRPADIKGKLINEALVAAKNDENPLAAGVRIEGATRVISGFLQRASELLRNKETDGLTVKLFFDRLQDLGQGLKTGYDHLVAKHDEPQPNQEAQRSYAQAIQALLDGKPDVAKQKNGGFLHVNEQHFLSAGETVNGRYYISPKLNGQPEEVIKTWIETLDNLELGDALYYKVAEDLLRRYDSLVLYATPKTKDDIERAVHEFTLRSSSELLSDTIIPTGVEIAKGIAHAPEPYQLDALLRYCGMKRVSYNQFACALTELALQRASFDFVRQGIGPDRVTPEALNTAAKPYFIQFMQLSGLDPVTMKSGQWWT